MASTPHGRVLSPQWDDEEPPSSSHPVQDEHGKIRISCSIKIADGVMPDRPYGQDVSKFMDVYWMNVFVVPGRNSQHSSTTYRQVSRAVLDCWNEFSAGDQASREESKARQAIVPGLAPRHLWMTAHSGRRASGRWFVESISHEDIKCDMSDFAVEGDHFIVVALKGPPRLCLDAGCADCNLS